MLSYKKLCFQMISHFIFGFALSVVKHLFKNHLLENLKGSQSLIEFTDNTGFASPEKISRSWYLKNFTTFFSQTIVGSYKREAS